MSPRTSRTSRSALLPPRRSCARNALGRGTIALSILVGVLSKAPPSGAHGQAVADRPVRGLVISGESTKFGGPIDAVAASDGIAVFGMGTSLVTADISGPLAPTIIGRIGELHTHWFVRSIAIGDGLAWVLSDRPDDDDVRFASVASLASWRSPSRQQRSYSQPPALVIDVSQPSAPRLLHTFDFVSEFEWDNGFTAIAARHRRAVTLRSTGDGVTLFHLDADKGTASLLVTRPLGWGGDVRWLDDDHLLLVGGKATYLGAARVPNTHVEIIRLDARAPYTATVVADVAIDSDDPVVDLTTDDNIAYLLLRGAEPVLLSFDLSDRAAPRLIDRIAVRVAPGLPRHCARSLALSPDRRTLYFSDDCQSVRAVATDGFGRLELTPYDVDVVADVDVRAFGRVSGIAVVGDRVAVATGLSLAVADGIAAAAPTNVGAWRTLLEPRWVALRGDLAVVIDRDLGLDVVDLVDGFPKRVRGRVQLPPAGEAPVGVAIGVEGMAWAMVGGALLGIDVEDPDAPHIVSRYAPDAPDARAFAVDGTRVALTGGACVEVLDAADPTTPLRVGEIVAPLPGDPSRNHCPDALAVDGDRLYLGGEALRIVDIGVPGQPRVLDGLARLVSALAVRGGTAIAAHERLGDSNATATVFDVGEDRWRLHRAIGCPLGCAQVGMTMMGDRTALLLRDRLLGLHVLLADGTPLVYSNASMLGLADEPGELAIDGGHVLTTSQFTDLVAYRLRIVEVRRQAYLPLLSRSPRADAP